MSGRTTAASRNSHSRTRKRPAIPGAIFAAPPAWEAVGVRGSRSAMARSFERDGYFVKLPAPALGAITTMARLAIFGPEWATSSSISPKMTMECSHWEATSPTKSPAV